MSALRTRSILISAFALLGGALLQLNEDPEWPEYVANQERLLREEGFAEAPIQGIYGTTR
jgi:hypothetical protein